MIESRSFRMLIGCLAVLVASGCSGTDTGATPDPSPIAAVVDYQNFTIQLPMDKFMVNDTEMHELDYARDLRIQPCMAKAGLQYPVFDLRRPDVAENQRYGIWSESLAAKYGYQKPPDPPSYQAAERQNSAPVDDAWIAAASKCGKENADLYPRIIPLDQTGISTYEQTVESEAGEKAINEWRDCLRSAGVQPPAKLWDPPGATAGDTASQIRIAVADTRCKKQVRLIPRLATIEAGLQSTYVHQHEAELEEQRRRIEAALVAARQVISTHGG